MTLQFVNLLYCPGCHEKLTETQDSLLCPGCNQVFPIINGIPSFVDEIDQFYEGRYTSTVKVFTNPILKLLYDVYTSVSIDSSLERFLKKVFKNRRGNLILDLGCGGGWQYLRQFGEVVGVDVSMVSLENAKLIYALAVHGNAYHLPFADNSFDMVCSFDLIGHIPGEDKGALLSEIYRVVKDNGFTAHNIECDSQSLLFRWAHQYPDLYQEYFVKMYGHYGLELPTAVFHRFRQQGFIPVVEKADACKSTIRPIHSYAIFFDNRFKDLSRWLKALVAVSRPFRQYRTIRLLANFLLGFLIPLNHLFSSTNNRDAVLVLYQKNIKSQDGQKNNVKAD